jgi:hypothetical protein
MPHRGLHEPRKQRVWPGGLRLELRMVLHGYIPRMRRDFHNLNQRTIGTKTHGTQPVGFELLPIGIVELVTVAVPLGNLLGTVAPGGPAPGE